MTPNPVIRLAGCIIPNDQGDILLIHREQPNKEQWETPGGKVEPGESDETAALRELKEEIGVDVVIDSKIGEGDFNEGDHTFHYVWFQAHLSQNAQFTFEPRFTEYRYFPLEELKHPSINLSAGSTKFIELFR